MFRRSVKRHNNNIIGIWYLLSPNPTVFEQRWAITTWKISRTFAHALKVCIPAAFIVWLIDDACKEKREGIEEFGVAKELTTDAVHFVLSHPN